MHISNKSEFVALMERIDEKLKKDAIPIHARSIQGWLLACKILKASLPLVGKAVPNVYAGESLSGHIHDWFDTRYGNRLKIDFSPGYFPITIRKDLYLARLPLLIGEVALFIDRAEHLSNTKSNSAELGPPYCNLLDLVVNLSRSIRRILTNEELNSISQACVTALNQTSTWQKAGSQFKRTIDDDLKLSATFAVEGKFGLSRWHSLQSAEKAIKKFVKDRGATASHVHDLKKLHTEAISVGLSPLSFTDLADAQCLADVRYEMASSNQNNALTANEAARRICTAIATQLVSSRRRP